MSDRSLPLQPNYTPPRNGDVLPASTLVPYGWQSTGDLDPMHTGPMTWQELCYRMYQDGLASLLPPAFVMPSGETAREYTLSVMRQHRRLERVTAARIAYQLACSRYGRGTDKALTALAAWDAELVSAGLLSH